MRSELRYKDGISWEERYKLMQRHVRDYYRALAKFNRDDYAPTDRDVFEFDKRDRLLRACAGVRGK